MPKVRIISAADDRYVQHLCVMFCSLLENTRAQNNLELMIIDGGISLENKNKLSSFLKDKYQLHLTYLKIDSEIYKTFKISNHISHATYYRISIPEIVPQSISKILYLDCDLVIKDDILKLWSINLDNSFLAAVEDLAGLERIPGLDLPKKSKYFNAGVMLLNLEMWRTYNINQKIINYLINHQEKIVLHDQDALNAVLSESWLSLPLKWNQQTAFFDYSLSRNYFDRENLSEAIKYPSIIHFSTSSKPWHYSNKHPWKSEYYKYLSMTPWADFKPRSDSILKRIKQRIKDYCPKPIYIFLHLIFNLIKLFKHIFTPIANS